MSKIRWQANAVFSVGVRGRLWALGQMTERKPFVLFFDAFTLDDQWSISETTAVKPLFLCATMGQFFRWSVVRKKDIRPTLPVPWPTHWLSNAHLTGFRDVTLWRNSDHELTVSMVRGESAGARLIEHDEVIGAKPTPPASRWTLVSPTDTEALARHELTGLWSSPALNERLWLCHKLGRNIDPDKCVALDLPVPDECYPYFSMQERQSIAEMDFIRENPTDP
ncbi:MAG: hypothetical protein U0271_16110 [Polyangiaceae bacterium]